MDRQLKIFLTESAKNLLTTSPSFEPYIPQSQQNSLQALLLLEGLADLTQSALESKKILMAALSSSKSKAKTKSSPPVPMPAEVKARPPLPAQGTHKFHLPPSIPAEIVLQELARAQEARSSVKKHSNILRASS